MQDRERERGVAEELTERERRVLEAVVRSYVDTAEPAGSRNIARRFELGISPATIRNTMSDLEEKGYLFHPHTSAGRIPTDRAYRVYVDHIIQPTILTAIEQDRLALELDAAGSSAVDQLVRRTTRALSLLSQELGIAIAPRLDKAVLERLELIQVGTNKVLLVATIRSGVVRTIYVDLPFEVPPDALTNLALLLNERLAGLTLRQIRETFPDRLRNAAAVDAGGEELLNIFMQSGAELFQLPEMEDAIHLGQASVLATQPEFMSGERLKGLIELTEQRDFLAGVLSAREHGEGLKVTIGAEHDTLELSDFTLVTAEYRVGDLKGVIGVIGPTRMPYEKVISIVDYTSSLINSILKKE